MKKVAILCGRFLPGYKDGGPVRTIANLVECLGKEYHFKIITNDRDHGDTEPYQGIRYTEPNFVGNAEVWYLPPGGFRNSVILKLTEDADVIYVCGPYNDYAYKTMFLKRIGKITCPVFVAAMGSFSRGALEIKNNKKKLYIAACKFFKLFENIKWSVTSAYEEDDVKRIIGRKAECIIAEDLPRKVEDVKLRTRGDITRVVFLSRICEMKNLLYAIEVLAEVTCEIIFDIYGILEDEVYWTKCERALEKLPGNIRWNSKGMVDSDKVVETFSEYDIFLFPTQGENYGHVIFEALSGGCIPIISDQTPWNDLERTGCGKVIALSNKQMFVQAIEMFAQMPQEELAKISIAANMYAKYKYECGVKKTGYRNIFG